MRNQNIGLTAAEARRFSFAKLIEALANPTDPFARDRAGFEFEACAAASRTAPGNGHRIPEDVLVAKRDLLSNDISAGAAMIGTTTAPSFIEALYNSMQTVKLGADTSWSGLTADVSIPAGDTLPSVAWKQPGGELTASTPSTRTVELKLRSVGATVNVDRRLIKQSAGLAERFVRTSLETALAVELDRVAICGEGTPGTPLGIIYQTGIGSVAGGDNGALPTNAHVLALESAVAEDNALLGSPGYLANAKTVKELKLQKTNATYGETPLWVSDPNNPGMGVLNGYRSAMSNNVPSTLTKGSASGTCSALIFGSWNDLLIARWGTGLDVVVDPYTSATTGMIRFTAWLDCDIAVRRVQSFAAMLDVLTTS